MLAAIRKSLIALILGLLPYVLFMGVSNTITVNGELIRDEKFNILGLVLAAAGLWLAVKSLRSNTEYAMLRKLVAVVAILVCVSQIPVSAGLFSPQRLIASMMPDSELPPLAYKGLDELNRRIPESILEKDDPAETRRAILSYKLAMIDDADRHMAYADLCHEGQYRVDIEAVQDLPDFLTEEERKDLAARVESVRRSPPDQCSERMTKYSMGKLVDTVNRVSDFVKILVDGYRARYL